MRTQVSLSALITMLLSLRRVCIDSLMVGHIITPHVQNGALSESQFCHK